MRRWCAVVGVALLFLLCVAGASSSTAGATLGGGAPRLLSATAEFAQPIIVSATSPQPLEPGFGTYAVVGLETMIAAALLCYAFLQGRRARRAALHRGIVQLRGPPSTRDRILLAP